jgi:TRAP-type C4-dicarboxylate transport system substrate-binding protein
MMRENFHRFQQLPPEQRRNLRQRWQAATPAERQRMIARARAARAARRPPPPR